MDNKRTKALEYNNAAFIQKPKSKLDFYSLCLLLMTNRHQYTYIHRTLLGIIRCKPTYRQVSQSRLYHIVFFVSFCCSAHRRQYICGYQIKTLSDQCRFNVWAYRGEFSVHAAPFMILKGNRLSLADSIITHNNGLDTLHNYALCFVAVWTSAWILEGRKTYMEYHYFTDRRSFWHCMVDYWSWCLHRLYEQILSFGGVVITLEVVKMVGRCCRRSRCAKFFALCLLLLTLIPVLLSFTSRDSTFWNPYDEWRGLRKDDDIHEIQAEEVSRPKYIVFIECLNEI